MRALFSKMLKQIMPQMMQSGLGSIRVGEGFYSVHIKKDTCIINPSESMQNIASSSSFTYFIHIYNCSS